MNNSFVFKWLDDIIEMVLDWDVREPKPSLGYGIVCQDGSAFLGCET